MPITQKICVAFTVLIVAWLVFMWTRGAISFNASEKHGLYKVKKDPIKYLAKPILGWILMMGVLAVPIFLFAFDVINVLQLILFVGVALYINYKIEQKFID